MTEHCGMCICRGCLMWWSHRCPHGGCFDDWRAKHRPFDREHPDETPRTGWSNWRTDQAYWCRGGAFYPTDECENYVHYDGSCIKECLEANVQLFQDGHIECCLVDSLGCEECFRRFNAKQEAKDEAYGLNNQKEISMIIEIQTRDLYPHPKNPRFDVGDVTELAESLKAKGQLQNLTVVPRESVEPDEALLDEYTVIIGHRRLAAAQAAGLETMICAVVEMDEKEQMETMLLENIQRADLSAIEQAQGFKSLFDMGMSADEISERTGFSRTTVYRRLKVGELDQGILRERCAEVQPTIEQLSKLEKIEDVEKRNEVLESIGTRNYYWKVEEAVKSERWERNKKKILGQIMPWAKTTKKNVWELENEKRYSLDDDDIIIKKPKDADKNKYVYVCGYGSICIGKEAKKNKETISAEDKKGKAEREARKAALKQAAETAYALRRAYVQAYSTYRKTDEVIRFAVRSLYINGEWSTAANEVRDLSGGEKVIGYSPLDAEEINALISGGAERALLISAYARMNDSATSALWDFDGAYCENNKLDSIYAALAELGYTPSRDEQALIDGTSDLYLKE